MPFPHLQKPNHANSSLAAGCCYAVWVSHSKPSDLLEGRLPLSVAQLKWDHCWNWQLRALGFKQKAHQTFHKSRFSLWCHEGGCCPGNVTLPTHSIPKMPQSQLGCWQLIMLSPQTALGLVGCSSSGVKSLWTEPTEEQEEHWNSWNVTAGLADL